MTKRPASALGFALVCLLPSAAHAQATPASAAGTLDAVVKEIRLLRQAFEKQSAAAARAQLLLGRLTLQDQRTARARQAVDRLEGDLASVERERDDLQAGGREAAHRLEEATDQEQRQRLEAEARMIRARLTDSLARLSTAEAHLAQARQALDVETSRYDELDTSLRDMDRQLQPAE